MSVRFTEEEAKDTMIDVLGEIYFHNPTTFYVGLSASVDDIPHLEVRYECCPLPFPRNCEVKVEK